MAQLERSVLATPAVDHRATRLSRGALVMIGVIAFVGALSSAALIISQVTGSPGFDAGTRTAEVVDGWMPASRAASQAATLEEAARAQDGWSAALLRPQSEVTDGWASALLTPEAEIADGWAARYLVSDDE